MSTRGVPHAYPYHFQADKWETIEIGTRQVRTLKLSCSSTNRSTNSTFSHTGWYAPEAKRLVRFVSDYKGGPTIEVTAWDVRPPATGSSVASQAPPPACGRPTPSPSLPPPFTRSTPAQPN